MQMQRVFEPRGHGACYGGILEKQSVNRFESRISAQLIFLTFQVTCIGLFVATALAHTAATALACAEAAV